MRVLRKGLVGDDVKQWELFLHGHGFTFKNQRDDKFDSETEALTKDFQKKHKLKQDGLVGNATLGAAMLEGLEMVPFVTEPEAKFPKEPSFEPILGNAAKDIVFGPLKFKAGPTTGPNAEFGKETITITNDFKKKKITSVSVPELVGIKGGGSGKKAFHADCAAQFAGVWAAWGRKKLLDRVLTFDGAFAARFVRCSKKQTLSNHAFGTAFDINADENPLGAQPALPGKKGCVFELVPIAHQFGFYWGGHFSRRDGMHFEIAKVLSPAEVATILAKF